MYSNLSKMIDRFLYSFFGFLDKIIENIENLVISKKKKRTTMLPYYAVTLASVITVASLVVPGLILVLHSHLLSLDYSVPSGQISLSQLVHL